MKNAWIELDLDRLAANLEAVRAVLAPGTELIFVVKANAYGHGMIPVARRAWRERIRWFAVAHLDEALKLRAALPEARILIMGVIQPADAAPAARRRLVPMVVSRAQGEALAAAAAAEGQSLRCHLKIDTGMGRLGCPWEGAAGIALHLARLPGLRLEGLCTHLASSDLEGSPEADAQAERFRAVVRACEDGGLGALFRHISNSGAVIRNLACDLDGIRPGLLVYGYGAQTAAAGSRAVTTEPWLQWKTRVVQVKRVPAGFPVSYHGTYTTPVATQIATIDVGYSDGYPRALSNAGHVLIGGRRCPVAGRVTMNLVMADVGPTARVAEGAEVVLIGTQGPESIWADELAARCHTIAYEILTNIRTEDCHVKGA